MTLRLGALTLCFVVVAGACTCDPLPVDDHKYACLSNADCGDLLCINGVCGGADLPDGGKDGGFDAGVDAGVDAGTDAGDD
ncbi:MAG: hypothetical protein H6Q89_2057, partial [Myxococcaceae bacterium]|nr:hypothetical protein [Myxococcaceae bacterium]